MSDPLAEALRDPSRTMEWEDRVRLAELIEKYEELLGRVLAERFAHPLPAKP